MNVVRFSRGDQRTQSAALLLTCTVALFASPAVAQVNRLQPVGDVVEVVDPSERISGNAAAGIVLVGENDTIGSDRLWAYLPEGVTSMLKLRISSVDGRYYAEIDYEPGGRHGWVALDLPLNKFGFLDNYANPMNEIAALLSDAEKPIFYPVRWGDSHRAPDGKSPGSLKHTDPLRVYMNTERAQAFVVVDEAPALCRAASDVSGFKFNAICELKLRDLLASEAGPGDNVVGRVEVLRRSGIRMLDPLALDVRIRY